VSEFLITILSGGVAGASVAAVLVKFLIQNQLSKSLKDYQHQLDIKKNAIQTDLSIYADNEKQKTLDFGRKRIEAVEVVYTQVILTSLPRHGFIKHVRTLPSNSLLDAKISVYFNAFKENYDAYAKAFDSIYNASKTLEQYGIYLDEELEQEITVVLSQINAYFSTKKQEMTKPYSHAQSLFQNSNLQLKDMDFDFATFFDKQIHEWNHITGPLRIHLKQKIRGFLTPEEHGKSK
jgi:gas vesicle protein